MANRPLSPSPVKVASSASQAAMPRSLKWRALDRERPPHPPRRRRQPVVVEDGLHPATISPSAKGDLEAHEAAAARHDGAYRVRAVEAQCGGAREGIGARPLAAVDHQQLRA